MQTLSSKKAKPKVRLFRTEMIVALTIILGLLLFASAVLEIRGSRRELKHLLREEGLAMMSALQKGTKNAMQAFDLVEDFMAEKLLNEARHIERLDYLNALTQQTLSQIADQSNIFRINVFNADGSRSLTNRRPEGDMGRQQAPRTLLHEIIKEGNDELVLGFRQGRFGSGNRFAVAKRRRKGGAIVLNIDAQHMLEIRRSIGAGRFIQDIGASEGVSYVVLQDTTGVLLASQGVQQITSISEDKFLQALVSSTKASTRFIDYQGKEVFEIVQALQVEDKAAGLLRIGLSTQHLREAERSAMGRIALVSVLLLGIGVLVVNIVLGAQSYRNLRHEYERIETYTGSILTNMTEAVVAVDRNGAITLFNRAAEKLFAIHATQAIGKDCMTVLPLLSPIFQQTLDTGTDQPAMEMSMKSGSQELVLLVSVAHLQSRNGQIDTAFAVIKDLTRQKKLEESLRRRDQLTAMGSLASGVAHEIRNPLNAISMIAQRFNKEFVPKADAEEYHRLSTAMFQETRRINEIVQQFLQFARPAKLNKQLTDLSRLVAHVATLVEPEAKEKGILVEYHCKSVPEISVDRDKLQQALLNLAQNSLQACSTGQKITFACEQRDESVRVMVSDTGKGIAKENLSKIFNLYFTTREEGTGLGLSIVQQIVSQHDGIIEVKSQEGEGTTFTISLPILE